MPALVRRPRRLLALALAPLLGLLLAELLLRLSGREPAPNPAGPRGLFARDDRYGVRLRAGFDGTHAHPEFEVRVAISADGMRDDPVGPRVPGRARVLQLGDSWAYGYGVERGEGWCDLLEGPALEVVNAAVPGHGTRQHARFAAEHPDLLEADVVLATFFPVNDLLDNVGPGSTERGGILMSPDVAAVVDERALYRFAVDRSDLLLLGLLWWNDVPTRIEVPTAGPDGLRPLHHLDLLARDPAPALEPGWAATDAALRDLAARVRAADAELVLVFLPLRHEWDGAFWERCVAAFDLDADALDPRAPARRTAALCEAAGVRFLDLGAALAARGDGEGLYYDYNRHPTAAGHAAITACLREALAGWELLAPAAD